MSERYEQGYEEQERLLDPHREEEQQRARLEAVDRLADRGIPTDSQDADEEIADLLDAVERFEEVVEARGGDLMVNRIGATEPEDPAFVPPARASGESAPAYRLRIEEATDRLRHRGSA
jgi:hypothetical protein